MNGTVIASVGDPRNYGLSGTLNYKSKNFNLFTTQGYNDRNNPGNAITNTDYLNDNNQITSSVNESRTNERFSKGYNGNFGVEWLLNESTSWTNSFNYRKSDGDNTDNVFQDYINGDGSFDYRRNRINFEGSDNESVEFNTNFIKKFKKDGHKLTIDGSFSQSDEFNDALITDTATNTNVVKFDTTLNDQKQSRNLIQMDYVLPLGEASQFEAGYRGDFQNY